jgi:hypothetical protein
MLFENTRCLGWGIFWYCLLTIACAGYAYRVNARYPSDDPRKRDYEPAAIILAPFTVPFFIILSIVIFILKALLYGLLLILFIAALIFVREPFIFKWLHKVAVFIGNKLLAANTMLIRLFLKPWVGQLEIKRAPYRMDPLFSRLI